MKTVTARGKRLVSTIVISLQNEIASGKIAAGTHLTTQAVADLLRVSRFPVAEAFRELSENGYLLHRKNRGYFVPLTGTPLGPAGNVAGFLDEIYFKIAEDRLSGAIPEKVSRGYLRSRYGVSQSELNQLLNRIGKEGWIEERPGYGLNFSEILTTPEALVKTYRVRMALEPASLLEPGYELDRAAALECRATEELILNGGHETMSADDLYDRGVRFHELIVGGSNNKFFLVALHQINSLRRLLAYRSMTTNRERYREQALEHLRILDEIEAGRNEAAAVLLRKHLETVIRNLEPLKDILAGKP
jgi:DNA-binding GntR family transcriptional regulator